MLPTQIMGITFYIIFILDQYLSIVGREAPNPFVLWVHHPSTPLEGEGWSFWSSFGKYLISYSNLADP